jgi:UTP--glucose-1-phosphate uridylyltransferase
MNYKNIFRKKMEKEGVAISVINLFLKYYEKLIDGERGIIPELDLESVSYGSLPRFENIEQKKVDNSVLKKSAIIKLNGGLGTSMGLSSPKSFIKVKDGKRFIDIAADQVRSLKKESGVEIPFILMNSGVTCELSDKFLDENSDLKVDGIPSSFIHNSHPKVEKDSLKPLTLHGGLEEWNPAGHGDIYISLFESGVLDSLLNRGVEYAFISNIDNLGATFDTSLLSHFAESGSPFMMEVVRRREMDKKGGHLARKEGLLTLRERAQADESDIAEFENIEKYSYFNSNSIWINLKKLKTLFEKGDAPELPFIANSKIVEGVDIFQIETAMGSAISLFDGATAIEISQTRFRPVKKCDDLLLLWSDRFELNSKSEIVEVDGATDNINVELDVKYFGSFSEFEKRVGEHVPSLKKCSSLKIEGDVSFGSSCVVKNRVVIKNSSCNKMVVEEKTLGESRSVYVNI